MLELFFWKAKQSTRDSPRHAQELGISAVYQEINLIPTLSVAENIYLGRQPMRFGLINMRAANRQARELLKTFNIDIDVTRDLSSYSIAIQQIVAIVRGVDLSVKVLILDEPTSSLDRHEVETLFSVIRSLKERGIGILLITHFLDQVYEISDRITVLRNGRKVGEHVTSELSKMKLITEMLGRELTEELEADNKQKAGEQEDREPFLQVQGFAHAARWNRLIWKSIRVKSSGWRVYWVRGEPKSLISSLALKKAKKARPVLKARKST